MSDMIDRDTAIAAMKDADLAFFGYGRAVDAIRALPAVEVGVKPGEIERAVWSAMMWAADNNPAFNGVPEYTDRGNSFAEVEARRAASRIRSALTVTSHDPAKVQALVDMIRWAHDTLYEINPDNYDHDEVCKLNNASVEVILGLAPLLGEKHGKTDEWWQQRAAIAAWKGEK